MPGERLGIVSLPPLVTIAFGIFPLKGPVQEILYPGLPPDTLNITEPFDSLKQKAPKAVKLTVNGTG